MQGPLLEAINYYIDTLPAYTFKGDCMYITYVVLPSLLPPSGWLSGKHPDKDTHVRW